VHWTKEEDDLLKKLHIDQGLSASLIAAQLRGKTRNAVIGRIHRMKLPRRGQADNVAHMRRLIRSGKAKPNNYILSAKKAGSETKAKAYAPRLNPEPFNAPAVNEIPTRTFATLERGECRWPIGDPAQPDFGFCGCPAIPGQTYCDNHRKRAYLVPDVRSRREISVPAESVRERETEGVS
jgi:GcrA cell cycle regulator